MEVNEKVTLEWNNMLKGMQAQVRFLETAPKVMYRQWSEMISLSSVPRRLYLVGCGDSYFCGLASERAFREFAGVDARAMEALEFSRYEMSFVTGQDWLVATSNSGNVSRTVESVIRAKKSGLRTFGISYNVGGELAKKSSGTLFYQYDDVGFGPGTISYTASLAAQYTMVAALADHVDRSTHTSTMLLQQLFDMGIKIRKTLDTLFEPTVILGRHAARLRQIVILGAGPNYGTALFGMAKQIESAHHNTVAQELEEWAHEQYFCTQENTLTIVIAPPGRSVDRAREQLQAVRDMKGEAVVLCSENDRETLNLADVGIGMPDTAPQDEWLTPILYQIPLQIFSYAFAQEVGSVMLGFDDQERMRVNFRQIFGSKVQE